MGLMRVFHGDMLLYFSVVWELFLESVCCTVGLRFQRGKFACFGTSLSWDKFVELVWCGTKVCVKLICTLNN